MNLESLSREELDRTLRALLRSRNPFGQTNELEHAVQELHVHRIELEMQNRALRETQSELEQSLQRYADLYEHLPLPYLTVAPNGQILSANRMAFEWLRRDRRELIGTFLSRFMEAYDAGRFAAHLESCLSIGEPVQIELTLRVSATDAKTVQVSSRRALGPTNSEPLIHVAMADVSALKQSQRTLADVNREQETFNYSISHDLRAPVVTISNYARIVLNEHAESLNEEGRGMVERIEHAAARMEATLRQLLDYSRLSRAEAVFETISLNDAVCELLIEHRDAIQAKRAEISVGPELPSVRGSRLHLGQVLGNLLRNALLYTRPGEAPRIAISAEMAGRLVIVRVADGGIGIDPRHHDRIFRIFERLHGAARYPGSGIGLAIARRAAERMNGRIWVESELEKGSTFFLELPCADA